MRGSEPIAVVGMAGLFPGALDVSTLWANICARRDAAAEVRAGRWIAGPEAMTSAKLAPDKAYTGRCCLLPDFSLDPQGLDLDPRLAAALDPLYHVVLKAAADAVPQQGAPVLNRERTAVILAAIVLPTDGASAVTRELLGPVLERAACGDAPPAAAADGGGRERYFAGRVAGFPAALTAKALGLGGGSYTLDAACASSLFAVKLACDQLRAGRADAVLAGGVSRPDCLFTQVGFSQLRALSPSGRCAPFDAAADGLVVGEGAGILVLKRLADAVRDGDRILGLIRGIGLSNDLGGSLLAPDSEGQLRAMRAAYAEAGWSPPDVDLIECHGAGTLVGDAAELASLHALWGGSGWSPGQCAIGSIKSMIGHLLTAAGAAGLIKVLLALNAATLPPTINFSAPPAGSPLAAGPFRVQTERAPWPRRRAGRPRRAAVSAFGFGGSNAHLLVEEWDPEHTRGAAGRAQRPARRPPPAAITGMAAAIGSAAALGEVAQVVLADRPLPVPRPKGRWKGCDAELVSLAGLEGAFLDEFSFESRTFRIPPREIADILPQHLLMLQTAADALADAGLAPRVERPAMGVVIGIDFDYQATDFHLRWYLERVFPAWRRTHLAHLPERQAADFLAELKAACGPPLTAARTLGALGSMVASRIAREFRLGGPAFVVSAEEASGLRALEIGVRALQSGELDAVLVGAVDLGGDLRSIALRRAVQPYAAGGEVRPFEPTAGGTLPGEGAVALVLKRADGARADGDRVYALVRGIGAAGGGGIEEPACSTNAYSRSLSRAMQEAGAELGAIGLFEAHGSGIAPEDRVESEALMRLTAGNRTGFALSSAKSLFGNTGAAAGIVSLLKAALCLFHEKILSASAPRPWPRDPAAGPRRAVTAAMTADGNCMHVVLEEDQSPAAPDPLAAQAVPPRRAAAAGTGLLRIKAAGGLLAPPPAPLSEHPAPGEKHGISRQPPAAAVLQELASVSEATARAHAAFLDLSSAMTRGVADLLKLEESLRGCGAAPLPAAAAIVSPAVPPAFTRDQCIEFARGSAARVLGPEFAEVDRFGARVRLPDEPLMLVDRILEIHGRKGSLGPGRIVTEHDVRPDAWYLDGGRAPVCIAVEAGQADLFLCAYLGIDLAVRGRRTYRLLDATVEFHRELPRPGETIRYEIEIDKFLRQGETYLFLFHFKGSIGGAPLITMTNGCAGFFTPDEAAHSGGIITAGDEAPGPQPKAPHAGVMPIPLAFESYDDKALDALRAGEAHACFGAFFHGVEIPAGQRLPGGRMRLIHRVLDFDPQGGRHGLGRIRAAADIHPEDWFLTCHFVDDRVMPGTLMYECCAHTLRVLLQRLGWIGLLPGARFAPLIGRPATLKCRGPVTPATSQVVYEVDIREFGCGPHPYAVADADMVADGRRIVRFTGMSLQLEGVDPADLEAFWSRRIGRLPPPPAAEPAGVPFDRSHLLEFARGKPSRAFGPRYRPFDEDRFIARLPTPPFLFIDRILRVEPEPWVLKPGGWVEAECAVAPDAWYVAADRAHSLPYCVLLEIALQPCGWLAAYMGSALKSDKPLKFRNLGGEAKILKEVKPAGNSLHTRTRLTQVSEVSDMLIEHFDFEVRQGQELVFQGSTYFGFFTAGALERQEGIREAAGGIPDPGGTDAAEAAAAQLPDHPPCTPGDPAGGAASGLAMPARALRMIDRVVRRDPRGGARGHGFVRGVKEVDPAEWFFEAHFYQDPVFPGSLGLESFIQLLKYEALQRWPGKIASHRFAAAVGSSHRWTYRGQILPSNRRVTVDAHITRAADTPYPELTAEGILRVDGLAIYRMEDFTVRLVPQ